MKLAVTIDTEEDGWNDYRRSHVTVENIKELPALQELFDEFDVRPTYLMTYPVAADEKSSAVLRDLYLRGRCDLGAHCHPWNTPPWEETDLKRNTMLCNLPSDLQYKKLLALRQLITERFGLSPISFRSGRWGYSEDVAVNLHRLGFRVDSSISPYIDWTADHGTDFSALSPRAFRFCAPRPFRESNEGDMVELPATIGYVGMGRPLRDCAQAILNHGLLGRTAVRDFLERAGVVRKVWLSPEVSDGDSMIMLAQSLMKKSYGLINMVFHSSSLTDGLTPFVRTRADRQRLLARIRAFLAFSRDAGITPITLSEAGKHL